MSEEAAATGSGQGDRETEIFVSHAPLWTRWIDRLLPRRQVLRYLLIGGWNTAFGYGCYAAFVALYSHVLPARYLPLTVDLASISGTPFGITMSFLCYKFFVFRTTGNYLIEWLRCFAVYGTATVPGLFVLPVLTRFLQSVPSLHQIAPYLAGAVVMGGTTIYTYYAHKNFSFSRPRSKSTLAEPGFGHPPSA